MRISLPWWARFYLKRIAGCLPLDYRIWRSLGLFRHGAMDSGEYALKVYRMHLPGPAQIERGRAGGTLLELGPGDALSGAMLAKTFGFSKSIFVDAASNARRDIGFYRSMRRYLADKGLPIPEIRSESFDSVCAEFNAAYLTEGLASLRGVADASVDFSLSHAVLEHVDRADVSKVVAELFRVTRPGGRSSHIVDLRDHLGGGLNHLRLESKQWETESVRRSGIYTNRLRIGEFAAIFDASGFEMEMLTPRRWPALPIRRQALAAPFRDMPDDELSVWEFHAVLRKPLPSSAAP